MTSAALVLAALADSVTFALLPPGAEANPIWAGQSFIWAGLGKACVTALLLTAPFGRYRSGVIAFGALAWTVGALSNLFVIVK